MTTAVLRREMWTQTQVEHPMMLEAETERMLPQAKSCQGVPAAREHQLPGSAGCQKL